MYEGSEDFCSKALHVNDNVLIRTGYRRTVHSYLSEFRWQWARAVSRRSAAAARIDRQAAALRDH